MTRPSRTYMALGLLLAVTAAARERPAGVGSAIDLDFSIQHEVLRPLEATTLLLCITNENPRSSRDVAPGDSFAFTFPDGVVADCGDVTVFSPDGSIAAGAFECGVDAGTVRLSYLGRRPTGWSFGDAVCAMIGYTAGPASSTVVTSMDVGNAGAFLAPSPPAILLSVAAGLGTPGPPGPTGAIGPAGPRGSSGVGAWRFAVSTGSVEAYENDPPEPIPGLDVNIELSAGSSIDVQVDALPFHCAPGGAFEVGEGGAVLLEVDGSVVARRSCAFYGFAPAGSSQFTPLGITWISPSLAAGVHRVRALFTFSYPGTTHRHAGCIGSDANDYRQARMAVKELLAAP